MDSTRTRRGLAAASLSAILVAAMAAGASAQGAEPITLTYLVDDSHVTVTWTEALAAAYMEQNPNVTISIER